jgi:hypothetical protein
LRGWLPHPQEDPEGGRRCAVALAFRPTQKRFPPACGCLLGHQSSSPADDSAIVAAAKDAVDQRLAFRLTKQYSW